jgi:DNA-binding XRE family transcriptional regulator
VITSVVSHHVGAYHVVAYHVVAKAVAVNNTYMATHGTATPPDRDKIARAVAIALKTLRHRQHIAQEDLAFKSGIERSHMSLLERGKGNPTLETVVRIAFHLGVSLQDFCEEFERALRQKKSV